MGQIGVGSSQRPWERMGTRRADLRFNGLAEGRCTFSDRHPPRSGQRSAPAPREFPDPLPSQSPPLTPGPSVFKNSKLSKSKRNRFLVKLAVSGCWQIGTPSTLGLRWEKAAAGPSSRLPHTCGPSAAAALLRALLCRLCSQLSFSVKILSPRVL